MSYCKQWRSFHAFTWRVVNLEYWKLKPNKLLGRQSVKKVGCGVMLVWILKLQFSSGGMKLELVGGCDSALPHTAHATESKHCF